MLYLKVEQGEEIEMWMGQQEHRDPKPRVQRCGRERLSVTLGA